MLDKDFWGVYALKGNLPSAPNKQIENLQILDFMKILGLKSKEEYQDVKSLRYDRLVIMGDPVRVTLHKGHKLLCLSSHFNLFNNG